MIEPRIIHGQEKMFVGRYLSMSLSKNRTAELWRGLMPRVKELENRVGDHFISLQIYPPEYHTSFRPELEFQKWALVEVSDSSSCPVDMDCLTLDAGFFAVFDYKGSSVDPSIFQYIYAEWLPKSGYLLDNRPHFEVLGTNYRNGDPNSEEEIWIPIKRP